MKEDTEDSEEFCIFTEVLSNCQKRQTKKLVKPSEPRLATVHKASKKRRDTLETQNIREKVAHKGCLLEYKSSDHIKRHLKRKNNGSYQEPILNNTYIPTAISRQEGQLYLSIFKRVVFSVETTVLLNLNRKTLRGGKKTKAYFVVQ